MNDPGQHYRQARRVTLVGALVNVLLAAIKVAFGYMGQSQALVADGLHSLSDLATDVIVLHAARHGSQAPDQEHPYGHARIETAASVAMGLILLVIAAGILYDAIHRLFTPALLLHPGWLALTIAGLSVLAKEGLYQYTMVVARLTRSRLLRANAWHHRTDAVSSIVVVVGVGGTMAGLPYLDAIGAAGVALMIAHVGWELAWHSVRELVDTGLDRERVEVIRRAILEVPGVDALHLLRTRRMGGDALVDVHIILKDPKISVSEGHQISEAVRSKLIEEIDEVYDVMVHIDPEDDERKAPCRGLPLRNAVESRLSQAWRDIAAANEIRHVALHYVNGKVEVDLVLPLRMVTSTDDGPAWSVLGCESS